MQRVTPHQIVAHAESAVKNSTYKHQGRYFKASDKKKMMVLIQNSGLTQDTVASYLSGVGSDSSLTWAGRFFHWVIALRDGTLDAQIALEAGAAETEQQQTLPFRVQGQTQSIQLAATPQVMPPKPFRDALVELIQNELKADGVSIHSVGVVIAAAFKECREKTLDAAREEVVRSLKKKGLTLDDIAI